MNDNTPSPRHRQRAWWELAVIYGQMAFWCLAPFGYVWLYLSDTDRRCEMAPSLTLPNSILLFFAVGAIGAFFLRRFRAELDEHAGARHQDRRPT